ncbi:MAG: vacuolar family H+-ATPase subunit H [Lachnospiraceae bacterium]|nr:vacuolar family H+-ATPase subunit H [Clostridiales bacterium]MDY3109608.1 vacuolar family H+-ATPase subunit H [Lachnospiraceae bacterium]
MSSKIEQLIDEIEDYINSCKYQTLSKTNIIVNKDEIDELLRELRMKTPDEIKRYQKIISNKEAILEDARTKAQALIDEATEHTTHLINEHEIMQQAYAQANEVVTLATRQAQEILDSATNDANGVRDAAMRYLDEMLANMENLMTSTLNTTTAHYESFYKAINSFNDVVKANRAEMHPELADLSNPETYDIQDEGEDA